MPNEQPLYQGPEKGMYSVPFSAPTKTSMEVNAAWKGRESDQYIPLIIKGEVPKQNPLYHVLCNEWKFLDASYKGGSRYKHATDADGHPVFITHANESQAGAENRKRMSSYRNFVKPIVDKFNSFVFSAASVSRSSNPTFMEWSRDVDGKGTCLQEFMKYAGQQAAILGTWFIMVDTTKSEDAITQAQAQASGSRVVLSNLHPTRVIDWSFDDKWLLVRHDDMGPNGCVRLWGPHTVQVGIIDNVGQVSEVLPATPHGWPVAPIIRDNGQCGGMSLVSDVAEINKIVFNLDSCLTEELLKHTFSQQVIIGLSSDDMPNDTNTKDLGSRKVLLINKPSDQVRLERMAADPSQAQQLRETIMGYVKDIYRIVGLKQPDEEVAPESGKALRVRMTETSAIAAAMADEQQATETRIMGMLSWAYEEELEPPQYPDEFNEDDLESELKITLDTLAGPFVPSIKRAQETKYASMAFADAPAEELAEMIGEIRKKASDPEEKPTPAQEVDDAKEPPEDAPPGA